VKFKLNNYLNSGIIDIVITDATPKNTASAELIFLSLGKNA
jgi:hypothetical protein